MHCVGVVNTDAEFYTVTHGQARASAEPGVALMSLPRGGGSEYWKTCSLSLPGKESLPAINKVHVSHNKSNTKHLQQHEFVCIEQFTTLRVKVQKSIYKASYTDFDFLLNRGNKKVT